MSDTSVHSETSGGGRADSQSYNKESIAESVSTVNRVRKVNTNHTTDVEGGQVRPNEAAEGEKKQNSKN